MTNMLRLSNKTSVPISSGQMEGAYPAMNKINKNAHCCLEKDVHHNITSKLLKMLEKDFLKVHMIFSQYNVTSSPVGEKATFYII